MRRLPNICVLTNLDHVDAVLVSKLSRAIGGPIVDHYDLAVRE
jgi:hypothetical protein